MRRPALISLLLIVLTLAAYWPVHQAGFTNYDDDVYVTDNPHVLHGLTPEGFRWAFTTFHACNWHPVTWLSHMADCSLFGENAAAFHLVNLSFHLANTLLLLLLLWRMTGAIWRSGFVAALFALHPLHVESVAWIAERKDVLSTFFLMLTLLAYVRYVRGKKLNGLNKLNKEREAATLVSGPSDSKLPPSSAFGAASEARNQPGACSPSSVAVRTKSAGGPAHSKTLARDKGPIELPSGSGVRSRRVGAALAWYALALALFALGLMSKPMLVTLPFVLLLLDFWPLRRLQIVDHGPEPKTGVRTALSAPEVERSDARTRLSALRLLLIEKAPFFLLSAASCAVTYWAQKTGGAIVPMKEVPFPSRLASSVVGYAAYLSKAFWPVKLAVPYPFVADLPAMKVALAVILLLAMTVLALLAARRAPYVLVGWLWFVGTLVPVIGLVQVGFQAMADRYSYVPLIGIFMAAVWGMAAGMERVNSKLHAANFTFHLSRFTHHASFAFAAMILAGCVLCTRLQVGYWRNNLTLFSHTLQVTQNNPVAEQCFGFALALSGKEDEAVRHFDAALRLWPDYEPALLDRGIALVMSGRIDEAVSDFREAIRRQPHSEKAYYQLAGALAHQNKLVEAKTNYLLALRYQPNFAEAHMKLGSVLLLEGDKTNAMSHLYEAVQINPDNAEGQYALGNELAQQQKFAEAAIHLRAAIKAQPNYASPLNDLAWLLATQTDPTVRDVPEAIRLAKRACELTWNKEPGLLATLGVAQSEAGQFSEAIHTTEQAVDVAVLAHDERTAAGLRRRLEFYRKGEAYHAIPR